MVLEQLIPAQIAEKQPYKVFPIAFLYATIAIFISLWIFPNNASLTLVFFTVMACLPLMLATIGLEKEKAENLLHETIFEYIGGVETSRNQSFMQVHRSFFMFFIFLMGGLISAFSLWFVALPHSTVNSLFSVQLGTISAINNNVNQIAGNFIAPSTYFGAILLNNIKVLAFVLLFSLIYGAGAIFILTWNASVISVAIGNAIRSIVAVSAAGYFAAFSIGLARYLTHGIPEIGAYFVGSLAGGMISMAIIKHDFWDKKFKKIVVDSSYLILLALCILIFAALLETFVSPLIAI